MMKSKSLLSFLFLSLAFAHNNSNAQAFEEGKNYASLSYGFGTFFGAGFGASKTLIEKAGINVSDIRLSTIGPISAKYEYAVSRHLGLGLGINYISNDVNYLDSYTSNGYTVVNRYELNRTSVSFLARANVHFGDHKKLDPYLGAGIGYRYEKWAQEYSFTSTDPNAKPSENSLPSFPGIPFGFEATFGVRYLFTPNVGAFAELGFAKSFTQFGVVAKF